jgi:hypothetical protein
MNFLDKIRSLPETQKKIILWGAVIIAAFGLFLLFLRNVRQGLKRLESSNLGAKFEMPDFSQELNKINAQYQSTTTQ